jgi:hypothetical protein
MLILFDHGTPRSIARWLQGHTVVEAVAKGWDTLGNGALLNAAEEAGFDLLLSTDKNIRYAELEGPPDRDRHPWQFAETRRAPLH